MNFAKLLFCGVSDLKDLRMVLGLETGGILIYPKMFEDVSQFVELMNLLKGRRVFVSCDHEGGQLETVPFVPPSPGNLLLGRTDPRFVRSYCEMAGNFLRKLGFNSVFAPVLDVKRTYSNAVVGYRSFGKDPKLVAEMGKAAIEGYRSAKILSCAKHFPGHGRSRKDSHEEFEIIDTSIEELQEDLLPFKEAINAKVDFVMLAHLVYSSLDTKPASISRKIVQEILREQLSFEGIVLSDAVEMKALSKRFKPHQIVQEFFNASGDMLIVSKAKNVKGYLEAIQENLQAGRIPKRVIERAIDRVNSKLVEVESDVANLFEAIEKAIEIKVSSLSPLAALLVLPDEISYSAADVSSSYVATIKKQARRYLNARCISFSKVCSVDAKHLLLDLIVDASENEISLHRELSKRFPTIYIITRNPHLAEHFSDRPHVVTYSLSPLVMGYVFRKLSQLSQGGV
ncbi:glycoside hydrolase family 3 N-terminal domain-containing protein [Pseudothermotoga sp.]